MKEPRKKKENIQKVDDSLPQIETENLIDKKGKMTRDIGREFRYGKKTGNVDDSRHK